MQYLDPRDSEGFLQIADGECARNLRQGPAKISYDE